MRDVMGPLEAYLRVVELGKNPYYEWKELLIAARANGSQAASALIDKMKTFEEIQKEYDQK